MHWKNSGLTQRKMGKCGKFMEPCCAGIWGGRTWMGAYWWVWADGEAEVGVGKGEISFFKKNYHTLIDRFILQDKQ